MGPSKANCSRDPFALFLGAGFLVGYALRYVNANSVALLIAQRLE